MAFGLSAMQRFGWLEVAVHEEGLGCLAFDGWAMPFKWRCCLAEKVKAELKCAPVSSGGG